MNVTSLTRGVGLLLFAPLLLAPIPRGSAGAMQQSVETESAKAWVGKKAKSFTLPGIDGNPVDIGTALGKKPTVLVFYRGVW